MDTYIAYNYQTNSLKLSVFCCMFFHTFQSQSVFSVQILPKGCGFSAGVGHTTFFPPASHCGTIPRPPGRCNSTAMITPKKGPLVQIAMKSSEFSTYFFIIFHGFSESKAKLSRVWNFHKFPLHMAVAFNKGNSHPLEFNFRQSTKVQALLWSNQHSDCLVLSSWLCYPLQFSSDYVNLWKKILL